MQSQQIAGVPWRKGWSCRWSGRARDSPIDEFAVVLREDLIEVRLHDILPRR